MLNVKAAFRLALSVVALGSSPLVSANTSPELLCTVSADNFPGFEDGTLESKTVQLTGIQGDAGGHITIYENASFRFRVITGRSQIQGETAILTVFYVEAQDLENDHNIRAASASYAGGPHHARPRSRARRRNVVGVAVPALVRLLRPTALVAPKIEKPGQKTNRAPRTTLFGYQSLSHISIFYQKTGYIMR